MRRDLAFSQKYQIFLNYPFDEEFDSLANAMNFAVVAGGMLPVCAFDISEPDRSRLDMIVHAVQNCMYSVHDLSRHRGEGAKNFVRMNMPLELGMALFHSMDTNNKQHRCAFLVAHSYEYKEFASDLAGLDPIIHNEDEEKMLVQMYEWLRRVVPASRFNSRPVAEIVDVYGKFRTKLQTVRGSGTGGAASHEERRELMYRICTEVDWWDWRNSKPGREAIPSVPILFMET